jgi:putative endonuclease
MEPWVYILECADKRLYVGSYRGDDIDVRVSEHNVGLYRNAWTYSRRPVTLLWADRFPLVTDAIAFERKLKGWTRAKKLAFVQCEWDRVRQLSQRRTGFAKVNPPSASPPSSFETDASHPPQDEGSEGLAVPNPSASSFAEPSS